MDRFNNPLDHVRIAAPCKANWEQMIGTDRVRFCGQCNLNVYNLSSMTRVQAESLIAQTEGRLCIRFYRRTDGSILTDNCPVGLRAIRRRLSYLAKAASAAVLSFFSGVGVYSVVSARQVHTSVMGTIAIRHSPLSNQEMGDMVEFTGNALVSPPEPLIMGKLIPIQNLAERKATRRRDKLRTVPTR
jgi:hypothetical protein